MGVCTLAPRDSAEIKGMGGGWYARLFKMAADSSGCHAERLMTKQWELRRAKPLQSTVHRRENDQMFPHAAIFPLYKLQFDAVIS